MAKTTILKLIKMLEQALEDAPHEAREFPVIVNALTGPVEINNVKVDVTAEAVWLGLLDEHAPSDPETDYLEEEVAMLEEALRAIRARIEGEYDHPALLRAGALGDKDADILRLIDPVLRD